MTLKELFNTFHYSNRVIVEGNPCGWCNEELNAVVYNECIPKSFEPYLNNIVKELEIDSYTSGQCCGYDIEVPYLHIIIK